MAKIDKLPDLPNYFGEITRSKDIPERNMIDIKIQIGKYKFQTPIWGEDRFEFYKKITQSEYQENDIVGELAMCSKKINNEGKDFLALSTVSNVETFKNYKKHKEEIDNKLNS